MIGNFQSHQPRKYCEKLTKANQPSMAPLPVFIACRYKSCLMDMSFERHSSFGRGKDTPKAQSGQQLDYARLIALSQSAISQRELADELASLTPKAGTKAGAKEGAGNASSDTDQSEDTAIRDSIAVIAGSHNGSRKNADTAKTRGAFLQRSAMGASGREREK